MSRSRKRTWVNETVQGLTEIADREKRSNYDCQTFRKRRKDSEKMLSEDPHENDSPVFNADALQGKADRAGQRSL